MNIGREQAAATDILTPILGVDSSYSPTGLRMPLDFPAASIFLFCSAAFCAWLAAYALMQPRTAFARNFVALMLCSTAYALGYGIELAAPGLAQIKAALRLQYLGIPFITPVWVGLAWSISTAAGCAP